MIDLLLDVEWNDVVDMVLVSSMLWVAFVWLQRSRARMALIGIGFLAALYLLARRLELQLTTWILQGFFAALVIVVVVVFQEDLRRLFEQIAVWGLRRRPPRLPSSATGVLVRTVALLARARTGALIVLPGSTPLDRHLEGGIALDGQFSSPLMLSLFDHHSPGHDGAVVLVGDRIARFAVHLPLSNNHREVGPGGTRHAAALGLAERSDALCIVVSEERGTISVARDGRLRVLPKAEALSTELIDFLDELSPSVSPATRPWTRLAGRWREALAAVGTAALLWLLLVAGSGLGEMSAEVPVRALNLPPGYSVEAIEPSEVEVVLSGPRRKLLLGEPEGLAFEIDALLVQLGRRTFRLEPEQLTLPPDLEVLSIEPRQVRLSVVQPPAPAPVRSPSAAAGDARDDGESGEPAGEANAADPPAG